MTVIKSTKVGDSETCESSGAKISPFFFYHVHGQTSPEAKVKPDEDEKVFQSANQVLTVSSVA
jgi:hypothetical protein